MVPAGGDGVVAVAVVVVVAMVVAVRVVVIVCVRNRAHRFLLPICVWP